MRNSIPLNMHPPHCGRIQQNVHEMVVQEIDLVDVQHPAVRTRKQTRGERMLTVTQYFLQVQGPDHPVLGGADR